ncbi:MAG TPA: AAA family ATPase [Nakamurella sp.]|nr:AAA family ATPase [Nakamurella sp.]
MPEVFAEFCAAGLWPGVGPVVAGQLAQAGITGPADVTAGKLAALPRMTDRRANRLMTSFVGAGHLYELAELLVPQEIPARWALRLTDSLEFADAAQALRGDPWRLLLLPDATVAEADRLARSIDPDVRRDDPRRGRALVAWTLARFARDGHTAAPESMVASALRPFGVDPRSALDAAAAAGTVVSVIDPSGSDEPWVSPKALADAESSVATHLARLVGSASSLAGERAIKGVLSELDSGPEPGARGSGLDAVQAGAVGLAAAHGVSLLTGGPGTGKSRTISAIVALCSKVQASIALAAPTGRAAKRLEELAGSNATTIHRLLGARPRSDSGDRASVFEHDADNPIEADLVVVDEASMLDIELGAALLSALRDGTHLVVVGDPAQLPSIGPGRVLGDLIDSGTVPVTELRTLYRQTEGGTIARLATAVRAGEVLAVDDPSHEVVVVPARGSEEAARRVVQVVTDSIPRVFSSSGDQIQVVTPVHRGPAGTQALNRALKAVLNPGTGTVRGFDVGDRVVATANHLDAEPTGYANGEVGTVVSTGDNTLRVAFTGGESEISGKPLADLLHGWAITVHRAQGSEWEAVVVVMPPEAGSMLSRPLVYTALTRARRHLTVVHAAGPQLAHAVRQIGSLPRRTRLEALLRAALTPAAVPGDAP